MNINCPNCQSKEWREGENVVVFKTSAEAEKTNMVGRMVLQPQVCQSCGCMLFFLIGEDEQDSKWSGQVTVKLK